MIVSFRDKRTREFAEGKLVKTFLGFSRQAEMKLDQLDAAASLKDLVVLPGNRFEALKGDRKGQYSVRNAHAHGQSTPNGLQQAIADDVAQRVVDVLETIEIQE